MKSSDICKKITEVFPEIGSCGVDLNVDYDKENKAWVVDLNKNGHHLKTYLDLQEADACVEGKECLSLGLQVGQLRENIVSMTHF